MYFLVFCPCTFVLHLHIRLHQMIKIFHINKNKYFEFSTFIILGPFCHSVLRTSLYMICKCRLCTPANYNWSHDMEWLHCIHLILYTYITSSRVTILEHQPLSDTKALALYVTLCHDIGWHNVPGIWHRVT